MQYDRYVAYNVDCSSFKTTHDIKYNNTEEHIIILLQMIKGKYM